ncbi:MAG TPA: hypothetical protein IAC41_00400, partial [Candidatus Merdenecus merdavium]|nr:hypothetical protein [Candidatus Merdenecus merdavium]
MMEFLQMTLITTIYIMITICYKRKWLELPKTVVQFLFKTLAISLGIVSLFKVFKNYIHLEGSNFYLFFLVKQLLISGLIAFLMVMMIRMTKVTILFEKKKHSKRFTIITLIISTLIILPSYIFIWGSDWLVENFGLIGPDEIIFHLKVPLEGTNTDVVAAYVKESLLFCLILLIISLIIIHILSKINIFVQIKLFHKKINNTITIKKILAVGLPILFILSARYAYINLDSNEYIELIRTNSTFIEDNFADPKEIDLSF